LAALLREDGIGAGDHLVDPLNRTKLLRYGLRHHRIQSQAALRQQVGNSSRWKRTMSGRIVPQ
jgi:hypothetical protein